MTFLSLLTKELRLSMRRERTVWVIVTYILLMGLLGWFTVATSSAYNNYYSGNALSTLGTNLYYLLSIVQLFLIMFITPAFTATTVNGEKERQTFDLLLCSRLSSFSLVAGKLCAGLANAFLLIAASIPLFSLVFFFGGVGPLQILQALVVYIITAIMLGTLGMLSSTLFGRAAVSTAVTYMAGLLWGAIPLLLSFVLVFANRTSLLTPAPGNPPQAPLIYIWNPVLALVSTYTGAGTSIGVYKILGLQMAPWLTYTLLNLIAAIILFLLSVWMVKPNPMRLLHARQQKNQPQPRQELATITALDDAR